MSSALADELLGELESEEETTKPQSSGVDESQGSDALQAPQVPMDEDNQPHNEHSVQPSREMQKEDLQRLDVGPDSGIGSVRSVCKLFDSDVMKETLAAIDHYVNLPQPDINGVLEESPEYQLIVRANNLSVEVDNDLMIAHKVSSWIVSDVCDAKRDCSTFESITRHASPSWKRWS